MFNQIAKDLFHFLKVPHITLALIVALLIRWLMSSTIPLGHDESYYWDWGRNLSGVTMIILQELHGFPGWGSFWRQSSGSEILASSYSLGSHFGACGMHYPYG